MSAALGAVGLIVGWAVTGPTLIDHLLGMLMGLYVLPAAYWGRHTVQRLTHRLGGLAILNAAAFGGGGWIAVIMGFFVGVMVWFVVGTFSVVVELPIAIVQWIEARRLIHLQRTFLAAATPA